jgi:hypothetical protein
MSEIPSDLVRIDETGTAHAVSRTASQKMRARKGTFRLMPAPDHIVFMRYVGEDGVRDDDDGAVVKLAGEVVKRGVICDIVALIGQAGWKGELVVLDGINTRSIFFDQGHVLAATSNAEGERLGEVLYQFGALSREEVEQCIAVKDKRVGDAAVELGLVTRDKLFQIMGRQAEEIVYSTLLVGDGMFYFLDRYEESRIPARHALSSSALLMEGVRRMDEMSYFRERIPSDEHVPVRAANKTAPAKAEPAELKVWHAIDGETSVAELGRYCEMSLFDVTRCIFQMAQSGHVNIRPPKRSDPVTVVENFNAVMRTIFRACTAHTASLQNTLASFGSSSGVYDVLFMFAGPDAEGAVKPERVLTNIASLAGDDVMTSLTQWLYEYATFALFAASSLLSKDEENALNRAVADIIGPLQQGQRSDNGLGMRVSILVD